MKPIENSAICPYCGGGHKSKPFCVYENGHWCFSCNKGKSSDRSFSPIIREIRDNNPDFPECTNNPNEFTIEALKWLLGFHVGAKEIRHWRIHQCPDGSLIYPQIDSEGIVTMYQQRWLGAERRIITKGAKSPFLITCGKRGDTVVLCEDYLSAIRIAEHSDVVCLWGTKCSYEFIKELVYKYTRFLVWLDNDATKQTNSGQEAAKQICKMLESSISYKNRKRFSHQQIVRNIATEHDPKKYSPSEIRSILNENLYL